MNEDIGAKKVVGSIPSATIYTEKRMDSLLTAKRRCEQCEAERGVARVKLIGFAYLLVLIHDPARGEG